MRSSLRATSGDGAGASSYQISATFPPVLGAGVGTSRNKTSEGRIGTTSTGSDGGAARLRAATLPSHFSDIGRFTQKPQPTQKSGAGVERRDVPGCGPCAVPVG